MLSVANKPIMLSVVAPNKGRQRLLELKSRMNYQIGQESPLKVAQVIYCTI
jgi:hypothetical protein